MSRYILSAIAFACAMGSSALPVLARTVAYDLNVYPETSSWEVVAQVDGDGEDQDGLAGTAFRLTDNVTWFEHTTPVIRGTSVGDVGFDLEMQAPFGDQFEFVSGHTNFRPDNKGFLFDIGNDADDNIDTSGGTARNVPWSNPVVLAVGGYNPSAGEIAFPAGDASSIADASLFLVDDQDDVVIIAADGSIIDPDLSGGSELSLNSTLMPALLSSIPAAAVVGQQDPIAFALNSTVLTGVNGPLEGQVEAWLIPEPSALVLLSLAGALVAVRRRR